MSNKYIQHTKTPKQYFNILGSLFCSLTTFCCAGSGIQKNIDDIPNDNHSNKMENSYETQSNDPSIQTANLNSVSIHEAYNSDSYDDMDDDKESDTDDEDSYWDASEDESQESEISAKSKRKYKMRLFVFRNKTTNRYTYLLGTRHSPKKSETPDKIAAAFIQHFKKINSIQSSDHMMPYLATEKPLYDNNKYDDNETDQIISGINNHFVKDSRFPAYAIDARDGDSDSPMDQATHDKLINIYEELQDLLDDSMPNAKAVTTCNDLKFISDELARYLTPKLKELKSKYFRTLLFNACNQLSYINDDYPGQKIFEYGILEEVFMNMMDALLEIYYLDNVLDKNRTGLCITGYHHTVNLLEEIELREDWDDLTTKRDQIGYISYENDEQFLSEVSKYFDKELEETIESNLLVTQDFE